MTRTYATLEVSEATYQEIYDLLKKNGYDHAFYSNGGLDMYGIALIKKEPSKKKAGDILSREESLAAGFTAEEIDNSDDGGAIVLEDDE